MITRLLLIFMALIMSASIHADNKHPGVDDVALGDVALKQIHPDVWVHVSSWEFENGMRYPSNGLIVRQDRALFLIDPAWGEKATESLLKAIDEQIGLPVRLALSTHFHDDRVAGDEVLKAHGIKVYASALTRELAAETGNIVPEAVLTEVDTVGDAISLGPVEVFYPGPGHTRDNLVVYVPEADILFGGCAIHEAGRDNAGNTKDADLRAWPESLQRVQTRYPEVRLVIPGHGEPGGPQLLNHSIALVRQAQ